MKQYKKHDFLKVLDGILDAAAKGTDGRGLIHLNNETDEKDQGWFILAGAVRSSCCGSVYRGGNLYDQMAAWTEGIADTDDPKSAWSTFALLYSLHLTGGKDGAFYRGLPENIRRLAEKFILQIDMKYLRAASKNYNAAAGLINKLRLNLGYISESACEKDPEDDIETMLNGYLADGFFNDDDVRGDQNDRRIDGYSAEIIGLLMHYDEITNGRTRHHQKIFNILKDFVRSNVWFIDKNGEYAKWGRSLRGASDAKKSFLWEYAALNRLTDNPAQAKRVSSMMFDFFLKYGINKKNMLVSRDKGQNTGMWDEYTTSIQASGYAAYGLSMAVRYCSDSISMSDSLPSENGSFVRYFPGSAFITGNSCKSSIHYTVCLQNRLTKLMYLWHNRITGENDYYADMCAKYLPLPYFGKNIPQPYASENYPFIPVLHLPEKILYPKNILPSAWELISCSEQSVIVRLRFGYALSRQFTAAGDAECETIIEYSASRIRFETSVQKCPPNAQIRIYFYGPAKKLKIRDNKIIIKGTKAAYEFSGHNQPEISFDDKTQLSIYGPVHTAVALFPAQTTALNYTLAWK